MFCSLCFFYYEHEKDHNIIDINRLESLEDNDISYKEATTEFDKLFKKMNCIKEKIELEIEKVNNSRDILLDEITKSFEEQRVKLNEKEKALKSELDLKVTELKDKLEKFYIESNDILSSCERINKAIQNYEKIMIIILKLKHSVIFQRLIKLMLKSKAFYKSPLRILKYLSKMIIL